MGRHISALAFVSDGLDHLPGQSRKLHGQIA
jgi:hypothetical protein